MTDEALPLDAPTPAPAKKRLRLILAATGALLLIGGGAAGFMMMSGTDAAVAEATPTFVDVPEMLVNVRSADGRARFLKVRVVLELPGADGVEAVNARMPVMIDSFQGFLRETRPEDLNGASGTFRVKEELLLRATHAAAPQPVSDVLIQELVQQ